jgi:ATP-binding cassette, subfamily A (ABC1), member 3|eukprot:COSAG03_NODE_1168_length_4664_cov_6.133949_2_plen_212_part_00
MVSMLSGVEDINSGEAWINDASVNTELAEARKLLGLCPQFDALMANLTAREHLKIFAMIRGVPADIAPDLIDRTITDMDLTLKADERTSGYSGGNKRKLSVALSMVANPTVNFLDEPSTGMDPETRRFMWNYIASVREGRALVLTTHSMEEADALCSKIGIMIRGQLRALGSSQQLKSQYGEGFQCMIRLGEVSFNHALALAACFSTDSQQ